MNVQTLFLAIPAAGVLALLYAGATSYWIKGRDAGNDRMKNIALQIQRGAMAFLRAEYARLLLFVIAVAIGLYFLNRSEPTSKSSPRVHEEVRMAEPCTGQPPDLVTDEHRQSEDAAVSAVGLDLGVAGRHHRVRTSARRRRP